MAVLAAILPIVSRSSVLALHLYQLAATEADAAKDIVATAKSINNVSLIVKQIGTIIKEDDRLPSSEAFETLEDVLDQCSAVLSEVEFNFPYQRSTEHYYGQPETQRLQLSASTVARLHYLVAHLDSLRSTLAVMLQTLYTAQSAMWARVRPTVSPAQCAMAVEHEKQQLETLIIEQQMAILLASKLFEPARPEMKLLMEHDSSQSLVTLDNDAPQPSNLFKYQDKFIANLDIRNQDEEHWLPAICSFSKSQLESLLERWSRLHQFEEDLRDEERKVQTQKRQGQQAFVESDSEEESDTLPRFSGNDVRYRQGSFQPLFAEPATPPIPVSNKPGLTAPLSPASSHTTSPKSSDSNLPVPAESSALPVSLRTSLTFPVQATAAVEAKDQDDDIDLEIPWTLCTRRHRWKYIDSKVYSSNTDAKPSEALSERNSWTEILASWVCKEAIQEAGYEFTQLQKERRDGRRTRFETCFRIEQPLKFEQVQKLVERTVEIYRITQPPTPQGSLRQSLERHPPLDIPSAPLHDRDRTPIADGYAPAYPPPPPLDRSSSMAAPHSPNSRPLNPYLPPSAAGNTIPYPMPPPPIQYPPPPPISQTYYPPPPPVPFDPRHFQQQNAYAPPPHMQSAHRQSFNGSRHKPHSSRQDYYSSTSGASESDSATQPRRHRSKSRRRDDGRMRKKDGRHTATKAMMGVAGLTALLDGLVGI